MSTVVAPVIQQEIELVNREFERLFEAGDPAGAARAVYALDATVLPPGALPVHGREAVAGFWAGAAAQMGIRAVHLTTVELRQQGEGAWEIGQASLDLAGDATAEVKYVAIWAREGGEWKLHVDIWNANS